MQISFVNNMDGCVNNFYPLKLSYDASVVTKCEPVRVWNSKKLKLAGLTKNLSLLEGEEYGAQRWFLKISALFFNIEN